MENGHKARDLLNATVAAFHKRDSKDLNSRQIYARKDFIARFNDRRSAYGGWPAKHYALASAGADVRYLAEQLDSFFFFQQVVDHVNIKTGFDVVGKDSLKIEPRIEGETFPRTERSQAFTQIVINVGSHRDGRVYSLDAIVGQLMHEMIHAYLLIYACNCWVCERDSLNTVGVEDDGHGPIFLMLHRLMLSEIRRWDDGLEGLLAEDCPRDVVSMSLRARAKAAMRSLDDKERRLLNAVRPNSFTSYRIRFNLNGTRVLVNPSLLTKQLQKESELKTRRRTQKVGEDWYVKEGEEEGGEYDLSSNKESSRGQDNSRSPSSEDVTGITSSEDVTGSLSSEDVTLE
ncbi:hypothetical protein F4818DRAFT_315265 [Hypoxylon cercidicola]|nr:hypothetical protein F4818DRAFT_315265 [Hypoxylon cercidicola]